MNADPPPSPPPSSSSPPPTHGTNNGDRCLRTTPPLPRGQSPPSLPFCLPRLVASGARITQNRTTDVCSAKDKKKKEKEEEEEEEGERARMLPPPPQKNSRIPSLGVAKRASRDESGRKRRRRKENLFPLQHSVTFLKCLLSPVEVGGKEKGRGRSRQ